MAEVIQDKTSETDSQATAKPGRSSRFTAAQDLVIAREVAASRAHTAAFGETKKLFEVAASKISANPAFDTEGKNVSWKAVQDRYKRLQKDYDHADNANQRLSGVGGGEMGELADLLMTMREAHDDLDVQKKAAKTAQKRKEEDKERMGQVLVDLATKRKNKSDDDDNTTEVCDEEPSSTAKKRKKRQTALLETEMDRFGEHLKDADLARVDLDRERLAFEREKAVEDRADRGRERDERRQEREIERRERREERVELQKLELEKFKAMIDAFNRNK